MNKYYVVPAEVIESNFPDDLDKLKKDCHVIYMDEKEEEVTAFGFDTEDVITRAEEDGYDIDEDDAKEVLQMMLMKADIGIGVSWDTVSHFVREYCKLNDIEQKEDDDE